MVFTSKRRQYASRIRPRFVLTGRVGQVERRLREIVGELGVSDESLRIRVKRAEIDAGDHHLPAQLGGLGTRVTETRELHNSQSYDG
jgi:hypothetical protein